MRIIKVNAINSTNEFARDLYRGNSQFEPSCVVAREQTKGKGQRGASWVSQSGENLTFSVLYPKLNIGINQQFLLSATVSICILNVLTMYNIPKLKVKWPNDIMSGKFKIGGILIENILKNDKMEASIIGVGLNVNQERFEGLPQAGSLKSVTGRSFKLDNLLQDILAEIELKLSALSDKSRTEVLETYAKNMFRLNKVSTFQMPDGEYLTGIIRGVTTAGRLNMEIEDSVFKTFDLKEVKLLY